MNCNRLYSLSAVQWSGESRFNRNAQVSDVCDLGNYDLRLPKKKVEKGQACTLIGIDWQVLSTRQ